MARARERAPDVEERLAEAGARINPVLEEILPPGAQDFMSEAIWYHLGTGGKRIRPALSLVTCEQFGGDPERALYFAAAVELLHNLLLIHDDAEDGDTIRRDRPAVWAKYGLANAINVADYMLGSALKAVMRSPVPDAMRVRLLREFCDAFQDTCGGQALDLNWRGIESLSVGDYLHLVTLKTGRYMALGMVGGGIIAGRDEGVVGSLAELGRCMGAAFQIRDDMIDLTLGKGRGGAVGNDIREGKSSILYAHAMSAASPAQRAELAAIMRKPRAETTDEDVRRGIEIYEEAGSMGFAQAEAEKLIEDAFAVIERLPARDRALFRAITEYMVSRNK